MLFSANTLPDQFLLCDAFKKTAIKSLYAKNISFSTWLIDSLMTPDSMGIARQPDKFLPQVIHKARQVVHLQKWI
jgi:hypothetical protein